MFIEIIKANKNAIIPKKMTNGSSGFDLFACEDTFIASCTIAVVNTGIKIKIPYGYEGQIRTRSSFASKGIIVANSPGTIDSDYRGELKIILYNTTKQKYLQIKKGDRIAQLVIVPITLCEFKEVNEFKKEENNKRNENGFGSTGI